MCRWALLGWGSDRVYIYIHIYNTTFPAVHTQARAEAPDSIRAHFGTDGSYNAVHGSDAPDTAAAEIDFFFGPRTTVGGCALGSGTTLAMIKPHAYRDKLGGYILDLIGEHRECRAQPPCVFFL